MQNQILSVTPGVLPSTLPRASWFRKRQTNKKKSPLLLPCSAPGPWCCNQGIGSSHYLQPAFPADQDRARINSSKNPTSDLVLQAKTRKRGRTGMIRYLRDREGPEHAGGEDGSLGEVSTWSANVLFPRHFSWVPRVLITALHKSNSLEGDFLLSSFSHPQHYSCS